METQLSLEQQREQVQAAFISKVYGWMSCALVITGVVAMWASSTEAVINILFGSGSSLPFYILIGAEIGAVIYLSARINKMSAETAGTVFLLYSVLNGLTLSMVFLVYTSQSIASTFLITALTFGVMSAYGYMTKKDLTSIGNLAFMALIGLIIASVVNFFMQSEMLHYIIGYAGVLIFVALTAYDTQKIKQMAAFDDDAETSKKKSIFGALTLYLDFVNLFLYLLRFLGDRK
ncbi:Bax inhibitor-1/YccA family protein [Flavicella sediminum]|uniref:Bax inhibitor-1/YccA family protein n=1 Tax=Flavicella sediminum TaxID=2585141 RepID=UPI00112086E0|nr:Bax inhibitor-1/YccA family protein [Flavicella sediminum]